MGGKCVSLCSCFSAQKIYPHKKHAKVRFFVTRFGKKLNAINPQKYMLSSAIYTKITYKIKKNAKKHKIICKCAQKVVPLHAFVVRYQKHDALQHSCTTVI